MSTRQAGLDFSASPHAPQLQQVSGWTSSGAGAARPLPRGVSTAGARIVRRTAWKVLRAPTFAMGRALLTWYNPDALKASPESAVDRDVMPKLHGTMAVLLDVR